MFHEYPKWITTAAGIKKIVRDPEEEARETALHLADNAPSAPITSDSRQPDTKRRQQPQNIKTDKP